MGDEVREFWLSDVKPLLAIGSGEDDDGAACDSEKLRDAVARLGEMIEGGSDGR